MNTTMFFTPTCTGERGERGGGGGGGGGGRDKGERGELELENKVSVCYQVS